MAKEKESKLGKPGSYRAKESLEKEGSGRRMADNSIKSSLGDAKKLSPGNRKSDCCGMCGKSMGRS